MPIARMSANSVSRLIVKPSAAIAAKAPMIVTGTVVAGTSIARQFCRKTRMTISTRIAGLDQRAVDLRDRRFDKFGRVVGHDIGEAIGEALGEFVHFRADFLRDRDGVRVRQQRNCDAGGRLAVEIERFAIGLRAKFGVADVANPGDTAAVGRNRP